MAASMSRTLAVIAKLRELGIADADILSVIETIERTPRSGGAERVARHRARKKEEEATRGTRDADDVTVTGNALLANVTEVVEKEKAPHTPKKENPLPKENPPKGGQKKGVRLPDGWRPSQADYDEASRCIGRQRTESEIAKFIDYWLAVPGEKGRKLNWDSTFRNWIRRLAENFGKGGPAPLFDGKSAAASDVEPMDDDQIRRYLRGHAETEYWPGGKVRDRLGPPPGWTGCRIPSHLLAEYERLKVEAA
jgi:hypothetical protein